MKPIPCSARQNHRKASAENGSIFFFAALDHCYWILGSVIGCTAGNLIPFNSEGIDFAMTALFLVIFVEQWEGTKNHLPSILGVLLTAVCRLIFGLDWFIPMAMVCIFFSLTVFRQKETA